MHIDLMAIPAANRLSPAVNPVTVHPKTISIIATDMIRACRMQAGNSYTKQYHQPGNILDLHLPVPISGRCNFRYRPPVYNPLVRPTFYTYIIPSDNTFLVSI